MGQVDAELSARKGLEVPAPQAPPASESAQENLQRAFYGLVRLAADHLSQPRTLRAADLERQIGPARALRKVRLNDHAALGHEPPTQVKKQRPHALGAVVNG